MINIAQNTLLNNTNSQLPNMSVTITSWFLDITFYTVKRVMQGAEWIETQGTALKTKGVVQPPSTKDLKIMPEGAWAWEWLWVHCLPDLQLETNQYIYYDNKKYKVMKKKDYSKYGYVEYFLLEAFTADNQTVVNNG